MVIFSWIPVNSTQNDGEINGIWLGTLKVQSIELRIALTFSNTGDGFMATMNSIDQSSGEIPFDSVEYDDEHLIVTNPQIGVVIEGDFDFKKNLFNAEFRQGPGKFQIVFNKVDALPAFERPQTPREPFPYISEDVTFENKTAGITISGTLTIPKTGGPFGAAILLTGSGSQDRNEEIFGHKPFLVLSDHLTRKGIAVLRYDDRGVGGTTAVEGSTTEGFAMDALAAVEYLKTRQEIDPSKTGFVGHSEGGMIASIAAARANDIAFIVMMAGPGIRFSDIILFQKEIRWKQLGMNEEDIALNRSWHNNIFAMTGQDISNETAVDKVMAYFNALTEDDKNRLQRSSESVRSEVNGLLESWLRYATRYDPAATLSQVKCPILAINGEKDMQVEAKTNLTAIEKILTESGHHNYSIKELEGLNHLFQTAGTGFEDEYIKIEETFSPIALNLISDWILEHTK